MSSKTDAVVKLSIVFFVSLLFFSVGTFVGKKYSDNQHQLAALEPQKNNAHGEREVASVNGTHSETKSGQMTDEEIAKLAEEFVADDVAPVPAAPHAEEGHGEAAPHGEVAAETKTHAEPKAETAKPANPKGDKHSPVTATEEPSAAAKNMVAGKTPTTHETAEHVTATKEERLPSSLPKDVAQYTVGKFTVQVASYTDEAEAQKLASDLKGKGYSAFYVPANIKGKQYYRVSVGQFATQKEAQSYRTELLAKSKVGSAIVQKITE
ncbi:SPOR domain-containing protein [Bdellovibrio sp. ArHS]|uniref:SPOR domain-containing protein n=1 Tax=Bdellovibrio sp. ArHS TaxID=1569284 RepID=UPI000A976AD4|nr:SPOR domain-containing protein [Bdellovibrio sp. ArHS]